MSARMLYASQFHMLEAHLINIFCMYVEVIAIYKTHMLSR